MAVERINENEILLMWKNAPKQSKCILSYQIYFRTTKQVPWKCITQDQRIPFLSYQHVGDIVGKMKMFSYFNVTSTQIYSPQDFIKSEQLTFLVGKEDFPEHSSTLLSTSISLIC